MTIIPVILSGGSGSRLWPLSRKQYPKQYLSLTGKNSLLQETILRLSGLANLSDPIIVCNEDHRFIVAEQLKQIKIDNPTILLEPVIRNTAPAITAAAIQLAKDNKDKDKTPLCIHRAPLGTHERFIGFLIEHYAGDFPLWLSPKQIIIIPVSDKYNDYANLVYKKIRENNIRVSLDLRSEKMGFKIRNAELNKIPLMIIVGENELKENLISIRRRFKGDIGKQALDAFIDTVKTEINNKGV